MMDRWIFIPMLLPVIVGIVLLLSSFLEHLRVTNRMVRTDGRALPDEGNLKKLHIFQQFFLI